MINPVLSFHDFCCPLLCVPHEKCMIFHENCLLADDSHVISYLIFCRKLGKISQNLSSAAVVIGALRVR